jgi:glycine/D-amino acid oxidase-like deaminating enzyme
MTRFFQFASTLVYFGILVSEAFLPKAAPHFRRGSSVTLLDQNEGGFFQGFRNFFQEIDAFLDDASARRLGNGSAFYGKRKSNFYGEQDKNRKKDRTSADPLEDYQGPSTAGYFQWMPDEEGQMRPVTRMKNQIIEKKEKEREQTYE